MSQQDDLSSRDPEVLHAIRAEVDREKNTLVMIENYASRAVMEAQSNVMTNKYVEGYPEKRYDGGCEYVDVAGISGLEAERALGRAGIAVNKNAVPFE